MKNLINRIKVAMSIGKGVKNTTSEIKVVVIENKIMLIFDRPTSAFEMDKMQALNFVEVLTSNLTKIRKS